MCVYKTRRLPQTVSHILGKETIIYSYMMRVCETSENKKKIKNVLAI